MGIAKFIGSTYSITPSGGSLTAIGGVESWQIQSGGADIDDITVAADSIQQLRRGLSDAGSVTLNVVRKFADVGQAALVTMRNAGNTGVLVITPANTGGTITCTVMVEHIPFNIAIGGHATSGITLRITGAVT